MGNAITFQSKMVSRGCEEFGPSRLVYTDIVHEDGTVEWSVKGASDGVHVDVHGVRNEGRTLDLEVVRAARLSSGWTVRV